FAETSSRSAPPPPSLTAKFAAIAQSPRRFSRAVARCARPPRRIRLDGSRCGVGPRACATPADSGLRRDTCSIVPQLLQRGGKRFRLPGDLFSQRHHRSHRGSRVEKRESTERIEPGAFPKQKHDREAGEG